MLLDEPLVNLDYKLREELRDELSQLFASASRPSSMPPPSDEALLLGGYTRCSMAASCCNTGRRRGLRRPRSLRVARAFSDPPMNLVKASAQPGGCCCRVTCRSPSRCPQRPILP